MIPLLSDLDLFIGAKSLWESSFSNNKWVNGERVPRGIVRKCYLLLVHPNSTSRAKP